MKNRLLLTEPLSPESYRGIPVHAHPGVHAEAEELLRSYVKPQAKVLDVGAGAGAFSLRLADSGYDVTATDKDAEEWAVPAIPFVSVDATADLERSLPEGSAFDAVVCLEVVEHVENQWELLRNIRALCAPGGVLLLTTPNVTSFLSRAMFLRSGRFHQFGDEDLAYGHISPVTRFEMELIADGTGWQVEEVRELGYLPLLDVSARRNTSISLNLLRLVARAIGGGDIEGWCLGFLLRNQV